MSSQEPITNKTIMAILARMDAQREVDAKKRETERKDRNKRLEGIGRTQWEVAEDLFYRNMKSVLTKKWMQIYKVDRNVKKIWGSEYDLIAINGNELVLAEVKAKLRDRDVSDFLERQIPAFRLEYPEYADYRLYGAVAWLIVPKDVELYAENQWLFVFTQQWEDGATIANSPDFKPRAM